MRQPLTLRLTPTITLARCLPLAVTATKDAGPGALLCMQQLDGVAASRAGLLSAALAVVQPAQAAAHIQTWHSEHSLEVPFASPVSPVMASALDIMH